MVVVALVLAWRFGYFHLVRRDQLLAVVDHARHDAFAGPLYVIAYALVTALGLPITVFSIVGGALFGAAVGVLLSWIGAMVGSVAAYSLARSIGQGSVRRFLGDHHLISQLKKRSDFWTLLRLRLLPVAPFAVLDYLAGLVGIRLGRLLLASAIGAFPTLVAYSYAGSELVLGFEHAGQARLRAFWIAGGVTLAMILISLVPPAIRRLRN